MTSLGFSYGATIGAAYLDRHPDRVRAMVLDSAFPASLTWEQVLSGQAAGFERALRAFLVDCERTSCAYRTAVPDELAAAYDRLVARVDAAPLPGDSTRTVGPGELLLGVLAALYDEEQWPVLAAALAGLACATWPAVPEELPAPVTGEGAAPVVVVATTGDPATPYAWAVDLADRLESAVLLTTRGQGHTVYGVDGPPCVVEAVDAYLLELEVPEPRTC